MIALDVCFKDRICGKLVKHSEDSYTFVYDEKYLSSAGARPISVNLPLRAEPFTSPALFPFFDNLISEGWLLEAQSSLLKIDSRDRFRLIEACGMECMGAVSLRRAE